MTTLQNLKVGDVIDGFSSNPHILVTSVVVAESVHDTQMIRYTGHMARGNGWTKKRYSWTFPADSTVELRP
jgi:hypothetical protein